MHHGCWKNGETVEPFLKMRLRIVYYASVEQRVFEKLLSV